MSFNIDCNDVGDVENKTLSSAYDNKKNLMSLIVIIPSRFEFIFSTISLKNI